MSYKICDAIEIIEKFAPLELMIEYDNSGVICGDILQPIKGVLITLDTNEEVVEDAIEKGCNLIIEHHPSIFTPIKRIDYRLPIHKAIVKAIKNDIVIYACHTNMDFTKNGLNDFVAKKLGLHDIYYYNNDCSSARIGQLKLPMSLSDYANKVSDILQDINLTVIGDMNKKISKIAVINGGGAIDTDTIMELCKDNVDVFITADIKYYIARFAKDYNYAIINFGHYESEICFMELVHNILKNALKGIEIIQTNKCSNPYN